MYVYVSVHKVVGSHGFSAMEGAAHLTTGTYIRHPTSEHIRTVVEIAFDLC